MVAVRWEKLHSAQAKFDRGPHPHTETGQLHTIDRGTARNPPESLHRLGIPGFSSDGLSVRNGLRFTIPGHPQMQSEAFDRWT